MNTDRASTLNTITSRTRVRVPAGREAPGWLAPAGLVLLSLVPIVAGAARLTELTGGAQITAENARFFGSPIPVVVHIISASTFCLLGAFQFAAADRLRRGRRNWHRIAGRILIPSGLLAALSGLWMSLFYALPPSDGEILRVLRLIFGSAMVLSIVLGALAIRSRDFKRHGAWMMRGYAIGLGAGTQVFTHVPWMLLVGVPDENTRAVLMGAGWMINVAVAEYLIWKNSGARGNRTSGRAVAPSAAPIVIE